MASASHRQANEIRFCWEQVLRTNRLFRISSVFAPADRAAQLLPLYALFGAVEEACSEHSDEDLARRKLGWWRSECARLERDGSDHPILRELVRSGTHEALRKDSLARLFDMAEARLDPAAPADLDELYRHCRRISQPQFELELSIWGESELPAPLRDTIGAVNGLAQLMREGMRRSAPANFWWLPLELMAHHGVSRADVNHERPPATVQALFADLLQGCRDSNPRVGYQKQMPAQEYAASRHLYVLGQLQANALQRLEPGKPRQFATRLSRLGLPQLYQAWKAAREFNHL